MDVHLADDYEFGTLLPSIKVLSADIPTFNLVCLSFEVTPIFGTAIDVTFSIVPLAIALLVGFATLFAAVYNPWTGTTDLLRATSNYGQDPDALRLVTPGISDILVSINQCSLESVGLTSSSILLCSIRMEAIICRGVR